jgi:hypothetical protein
MLQTYIGVKNLNEYLKNNFDKQIIIYGIFLCGF